MAVGGDQVAAAALCAVLGLAAGSAATMLARRVPAKLPVGLPYVCPACDEPLSAGDSVPLVSAIALKNRCRACAASIPGRYAFEELAGALLLGAVGFRFGFDWALPGFLVFAAGLLALSIVDLEQYLLPNRILYPTLFAIAPLLAAAALLDGHPRKIETAALGYVAGFVPFFVMNFVSPRAMAFGDVRLAGVIGLALGWLGLGYVPIGLFLGFFSSAVVSIPLLLVRRRRLGSHIPFGPFMAIGAMIAVLWGHGLVDAWLGRYR